MEKSKQLSLPFEAKKVLELNPHLKKFKVGSFVSWFNESGFTEFGFITDIWWEREDYHFARVYDTKGNTTIQMLKHFKLEENLNEE